MEVVRQVLVILLPKYSRRVDKQVVQRDLDFLAYKDLDRLFSSRFPLSPEAFDVSIQKTNIVHEYLKGLPCASP